MPRLKCNFLENRIVQNRPHTDSSGIYHYKVEFSPAKWNLVLQATEKKNNRKSKDGNKENGYRNDLYLNSDVVTEDEWTVEKIKNRTDKIVEILLEMFAW